MYFDTKGEKERFMQWMTERATKGPTEAEIEAAEKRVDQYFDTNDGKPIDMRKVVLAALDVEG